MLKNFEVEILKVEVFFLKSKGPVKIYGNMGPGSGIRGHMKFHGWFCMGSCKILIPSDMGS